VGQSYYKWKAGQFQRKQRVVLVIEKEARFILTQDRDIEVKNDNRFGFWAIKHQEILLPST
jgi:hypothetical protein